MDEWTGRRPEPASPYYPYRKVTAGATLSGIEELPYKLTRYLMDLPSEGYVPPSDNRFPRARLKKLLFWDGERPLDKPLPTAREMAAIQFDPTRPADPPDAERGYRIFSQELVRQSQTKAQSVLRIYLGTCQRYQLKNTFVYRQTVLFDVMVNYDLECNMQTVGNSRSSAITQAIAEAIEGVNFGGIGALVINSITRFDDERSNTGSKIYAQVDWNGDAEYS